MPHSSSQKTGSINNLYKGKDLGAGRFGSVFTLNGSQGQPTNLVAKIIDTNLLDPEISKHKKVRLTINEIKVLNQLGLLEGYAREDAVFTIVMKEANGLQAHFFNGNNIKWEMYRAIRHLYQKNIVHSHTYTDNFIVDPNYDRLKVTLIDFGIANEVTFCNVTLDHLSFFGRNFYSSPKLLTILSFYVSEMIQHAIDNKFETCIQLLLIGAFTLSALYGIPTLAMIHIMVREFITTLLWRQLATEFTAQSIEELMHFILSKKIKSRKVLNILESIITLLQSALSIYLMGSLLSYQWLKERGPFVKQNFQCIKDKAWQHLFSNATPELLCTTAMMYFPIAQLIETLQKCVDYSPPRSSKAEFGLLFYYQSSQSLFKESSSQHL